MLVELRLKMSENPVYPKACEHNERKYILNLLKNIIFMNYLFLRRNN